MNCHELWKQEATRWKEECKRNRYQKEQWGKISDEILSEETFAAFRKMRDKGWTHGLTELLDVGQDNKIRWKQRPPPPVRIQRLVYDSIKNLPSGHILHNLSQQGGLEALWLLLFEKKDPSSITSLQYREMLKILVRSIEFPGGITRIGCDDGASFSYPEHEVQIAPFSIMMFFILAIL